MEKYGVSKEELKSELQEKYAQAMEKRTTTKLASIDAMKDFLDASDVELAILREKIDSLERQD